MRKLYFFLLRTIICIIFISPFVLKAQVPKVPNSHLDSNVVYGMYSGLALLMNIYQPEKPNGYGIIYVPGSGFHSPLHFAAPSITQWIHPWVPALVNAGYTVFVINHRMAPRFRHPAALEDVQRAIRFVGYHAHRWKINADRLGIGGYSSGGTLATLAGVLETEISKTSDDPVEDVSAKVQCVMSGGGAYDFTSLSTVGALQIVGSYLGMTISLGYSKTGEEFQTYKNASPVFHASAGDADLLIIHGDAGNLLPFSQAQAMDSAARKAGIKSEMVIIPGGTHGKLNTPNAPDYLKSMVQWFDNCLKKKD